MFCTRKEVMIEMATYNYNNAGNANIVNNGQSLAQGDVLKFNRTGNKNTGTPIKWTVPYEGLYKVYARGGTGGNSDAAYLAANQITVPNIHLRKGEELVILVGQTGGDMVAGDRGSGGGGGTFICKVDPSAPDIFVPFNVRVKPLVVGGGGPGLSGDMDTASYDHQKNTTQSNKNAGTGSPTDHGGGGFRTAGGSSNSFLSGGKGLNNDGYYGGYGCGGAPKSNYTGGGGGGGYTGGQGNNGYGGDTECGAPFCYAGGTFTSGLASRDIRDGECSITYTRVITPPSSVNIVKSGNKIVLQGLPTHSDIKKYELDLYVNGTKRPLVTKDGVPANTIDLDTMENLHSLLKNGDNVFRVDMRITIDSVNTPLSDWFTKTVTITLDPRYPEIEWRDYDGQYIVPDSTLLSPFRVTNANIPHTRTQVVATQNEEEICNITKEGVEHIDVPLSGCSVSGLVTVTTTITVLASNPNGFTTDKTKTFSKTYTVQPLKNPDIQASYDTIQTGDTVSARWTPVYSGTYTMRVYSGEVLLAEEGNLIYGGSMSVTSNTPSDKCRIGVQANNGYVLYPEYFSEYFNITDMFWNTNNLEFPALTTTVDGSLSRIDVYINDTLRLTFNQSTSGYNIPVYFFRKGENIIRLVATDVVNGTIEDSITFYLQFNKEDITLLDSLTITPYHAFIGTDGVETYNAGNITATSPLDLGVLEYESVHHTPELPTSNVTQKVVVSRTTKEHMNLSPIKITGAIE